MKNELLQKALQIQHANSINLKKMKVIMHLLLYIHRRNCYIQ